MVCTVNKGIVGENKPIVGADEVQNGPMEAPNAYSQKTNYWKNKTEYEGTKVYQRDDLIDPTLVDSRGRTNLQRMEKGLAPLDSNGQPINLHHMLQTPDGPIAEMTQSFHQENSSTIHINSNKIPSGIDRSQFNSWKRQYWINRALDF
jgi:hypothetical protein